MVMAGPGHKYRACNGDRRRATGALLTCQTRKTQARLEPVGTHAGCAGARGSSRARLELTTTPGHGAHLVAPVEAGCGRVASGPHLLSPCSLSRLSALHPFSEILSVTKKGAPEVEAQEPLCARVERCPAGCARALSEHSRTCK